jgi:hypothetical protein
MDSHLWSTRQGRNVTRLPRGSSIRLFDGTNPRSRPSSGASTEAERPGKTSGCSAAEGLHPGERRIVLGRTARSARPAADPAERLIQLSHAQDCRESTSRFYAGDAKHSHCCASCDPLPPRSKSSWTYLGALGKRAAVALGRHSGSRSAHHHDSAAYLGARSRSQLLHFPPHLRNWATIQRVATSTPTSVARFPRGEARDGLPAIAVADRSP